MSNSNEPEEKAMVLEESIVSKDEAKDLLKKRGWIMIKSDLLNDIIYIAMDSKVQIPGNPAVVYTPDELRALKGLEPQDVMFLHGMKIAYGGKISIPDVIKDKQKNRKGENN